MQRRERGRGVPGTTQLWHCWRESFTRPLVLPLRERCREIFDLHWVSCLFCFADGYDGLAGTDVSSQAQWEVVSR